MSRTDAERILDVREVDGPPFDAIMRALDDLDPGERLRLVVPFEPIPLYEVLDERGYAYETNTPDPGLYHVLIGEP